MTPFQAALARVIAGLSTYIATRPVALDTLFLARFLPPVTSTTAEIQTGSFRIVTTPAPLTGVDSRFAKVADIKQVSFSGTTFKLSAEARLNEGMQDAMHARANATILRAAQGLQGGQNAQQVYENFISRLVEDGLMLSLDYGEEIFRAIALAYGKINVTDSSTGNKVDVDFAVPSTHKVSRTGTDAYDKSASKFWDDVQLARDRLRVEPTCIMNSTTFNAIAGNAANGAIPVERTQVTPSVTQYVLVQAAKNADGSFNFGQRTLDVRKTVTVFVYAGKADAPDAPYFWPDGKTTFIRTTNREVELIDGQIVSGALGVTHIGPNTESGQQSTRFSQVYVPEGAPYEVVARAAEDVLPALDEARNVVLSTTEIGAS